MEKYGRAIQKNLFTYTKHDSTFSHTHKNSKMFNITLKYFSFFNNKPPARWVEHITRNFFSCSYYNSMIYHTAFTYHLYYLVGICISFFPLVYFSCLVYTFTSSYAKICNHPQPSTTTQNHPQPLTTTERSKDNKRITKRINFNFHSKGLFLCSFEYHSHCLFLGVYNIRQPVREVP